MPTLPALSESTVPDGGLIGPPPAEIIPGGQYAVRFAQTRNEIEAVQKMRFEVFNLELGQGLDTSYETGRDEDRFDATCHHLMAVKLGTDKPVGTYRVQTAEMAATGKGFYSTTHFDLSTLPASLLDEAVEMGRACIDIEHRSVKVLQMLWQGLGLYLNRQGKRYLFGCSALRSKDPAKGMRVFNYLVQEGHMHPTFSVLPHPHLSCMALGNTTQCADTSEVPPLLRAYLRRGAKVCGPPAFDLEFGTIDYFSVIDPEGLDPNALDYYYYRK